MLGLINSSLDSKKALTNMGSGLEPQVIFDETKGHTFMLGLKVTYKKNGYGDKRKSTKGFFSFSTM